jgi:hypothetical protein
MSKLRQFLETPISRLLVISACTAKKAVGSLAESSHLTVNDLDDPTRRTEKEAQLADYRLPAAKMYLGDGHAFVSNGVQALREQGYNVSHFILSAGYGLLSETDIIVPYNVTFSRASKVWIRERGQRLKLRGQLIEVAGKYDRAIVILGREYLEAIGLPLPPQALPPTLAYIAPSFAKRIGEGIETVSVGPAERREIGAYSSSAKEKRFLRDVQSLMG